MKNATFTIHSQIFVVVLFLPLKNFLSFYYKITKIAFSFVFSSLT